MSQRFKYSSNGSLEIPIKGQSYYQPSIHVRINAFSIKRSGHINFITLLFYLIFSTLIYKPAVAQDPIEEMSFTVENLCPVLAGSQDNLSAAERDVFYRCGEVKINVADGQTFEDLSEGQLNALSHMAGDEASVSETATVKLSGPQQQVITSRLQALRKGSGGGLAINLRKEPILLAGPISTLTGTDLDQSSISDSGRLGLFITGSFATGEKDASIIEPGFDYANTAITAGMDYRISDQWIAGVALGYSAANADLNADSGELDVDGFAASLYSTYYLEQLYINAMLTAGWRDYQSKRRLNYSMTRNPNDPLAPTNPQTNVNQTFEGDSDATEFSASFGGGYDFYAGGLTFGPYASANYFTTTIDAFNESLASNNTNDGFGLALNYAEQEVESFTTTLGIMLSYAISTGLGIISPHIHADWEHEYNDDNDAIEAKFVNGGGFAEAVANNVIIIPTEVPDSDFYNLGIGAAATFPYGISAFADYTTILGFKDFTYHQIAGGVRFEF